MLHLYIAVLCCAVGGGGGGGGSCDPQDPPPLDPAMLDSASAASANTQPEEDKTRALLAAILDKIKTDGDKFELLVRIMCEFADLVTLADDMEAVVKIEKESSTRNVIVIRPPFKSSASNTSDSALGESLEASSTEMFSARQDPDNVSLDGLEDVLSDNEYDILVNDTEPVPETAVSSCDDTRSAQSESVVEPGVAPTSRPLFGQPTSKTFT